MKYKANAKTLLSTLTILALPVMAVTFVALASSVDVAVVDVDLPVNSITLAPGQSSAITINMTVTGKQDGTATFRVYRDWTLSGGVFTGSYPQVFEVGPRAAQDLANTFTASGTVTVAAGQADGAFTLSVGAFGITNSNTTGAKLAAGSSSNYHVTVEAPVVPPTPSDTTPPLVNISFATPDGLSGWFVTSPVGGSLTASDSSNVTAVTVVGAAYGNEVGLGTPEVTGDLTVSTEGTSDVEATALDGAGNGGAAPGSNNTATIQIDTGLPVVTITLPDTGNGAGVYLLNEAVTATWSPTDPTPGSGLATDPGIVPITVPTTSVGGNSLSVDAGSVMDVAGNLSLQASASYSVYYAWGGFLSPVTAGGKGLFKLGSTVPVKFALFDANGAAVSTAVANLYVAKMTNATEYGDYELIVSTSNATTGNLFRYSDGSYIFNLGTKNLSTGTWRIEVRLNDGTSQYITICFK